jgi:hypothetical protein
MQTCVTTTDLRAGGRRKRDELRKVVEQVTKVEAVLADAALETVPVCGVLCLANRNEGCPSYELVRIGRVTVGHPELVAALAGSEGDCTPETVAAAYAALTRRFNVRGGGSPPAGTFMPGPAPRERSTAVLKHRRPAPPALTSAGPPGPSPRGRRSGWAFVLIEVLPLVVAVLLLLAMARALV